MPRSVVAPPRPARHGPSCAVGRTAAGARGPSRRTPSRWVSRRWVSRREPPSRWRPGRPPGGLPPTRSDSRSLRSRDPATVCVMPRVAPRPVPSPAGCRGCVRPGRPGHPLRPEMDPMLPARCRRPRPGQQLRRFPRRRRSPTRGSMAPRPRPPQPRRLPQTQPPREAGPPSPGAGPAHGRPATSRPSEAFPPVRPTGSRASAGLRRAEQGGAPRHRASATARTA